MKYASLALALMCTAVASAQQNNTQQYAQLVNKLKNDDTNIDFGQLRMAYAASPGYDFDTDSEARKSMFAALQKQDYKRAIGVAEKALDQDYVDIDAHFVLEQAYKALGDDKQAAFHHAVVKGLIESILKSGDGAGYDTAYKVIAIREEYIVLQVKALQLIRQSLDRQGKHEFDVIDGTDEQKQGHRIYFNIDLPRAAEAKAFSGK